MVTLRTTTLLVLLFTVFNLNSQTIVSGLVSGNWEADGNPYIVEGNLFVGPDERLTIKSGVEILFAGNFGLEVYGRLDVNGTDDAKVLFSLQDTTGFASGVAGWKGIVFPSFMGSNPENSNLNYSIIEYSLNNGVTCYDFPYLKISNSIIRNNLGHGLGIYEFSQIEVNGIEIHNCEQGGIDIEFSTPQITNFLIENNNGPGIRLYGDLNGGQSTLFSQGEITANHTEGFGGGIQLAYNYSVEVKNVSISQNTAQQGGGIYTEEGFLMLEHVTISSNQSVLGGGLYNTDGTDMEMKYCVIADNYASMDGGAIYLNESKLNMNRTTISNNEAGNVGGGIFYQVQNQQASQISSSIVWGNSPEDMFVTALDPIVNYSNIGGGFLGMNNIDADPLYLDSEAGNYQLSWNSYPNVNASMSPCIDAGDPENINDPDGTVADIGAYYYYQSVVTKVQDLSMEKFVIFPNPATSSISMKASAGMEKISIMDLSGQLVSQVSGKSMDNRIDISSLKSGVYFVRVNWENGNVSTEKLIKE